MSPETDQPSFITKMMPGVIIVSTFALLAGLANASNEAMHSLEQPWAPSEIEVVKPVDSEITGTIKKTLKGADLRSENIAVETQNGVVQLSGEVESESNAVLAVLIAQEIPGVVVVKNKLIAIGMEGMKGMEGTHF